MEIGQVCFARMGRFFIFASILSLLISCSSKPEDVVLGKWGTVDGSAKIELFKDGNITIAEKGVSTEKYLLVSGKYSFLDKDKIKIDLDGYQQIGGPTIITVSFSGEEMAWTYPNGEVLKYQRRD